MGCISSHIHFKVLARLPRAIGRYYVHFVSGSLNPKFVMSYCALLAFCSFLSGRQAMDVTAAVCMTTLFLLCSYYYHDLEGDGCAPVLLC